MKFFLSLLLSFVAYCYTSSAIAQAPVGFEINGTVMETATKPSLGASVDLLDADKKTLQSSFVDEQGNFRFQNVSPNTYYLYISNYDFEDTTFSVIVTDKNLRIQNIRLNKLVAESLNTIHFQADRTPVQQKDDTTQFDARAYKTNPDASAEDLIRKMPGIDLSSGTPKAQGENISKVMIDGKPFFGDDPSAALKNLPAEVIDKIQIYDEKSEQSQFSGFDDGNTSKTLNITTRKDKKEGVFGKIYVGAGADYAATNTGLTNADRERQFRYSNGGSVSYFKGSRRITLMGLNNNINQQNFSSQDLVGAGPGAQRMRGGGAGGRGGSGAMMGNLGGSNRGINNTNAIGINYSDVWNEKVEVTGSYTFNNIQNTTTQDIKRLFQTVTQQGQSYEERDLGNSTNNNHRFNGRIKYTIDSNNTLLIMPSLSYQKNKSTNNVTAASFLNNLLTSTTSNENLRDSEGLNANLRALYSHKFKKSGRTASLWLDGGYNATNIQNKLYAINEDIETLLYDTLNQKSLTDREGWNTNANLSYTEPLSQKSALQFRYKFGNNFSSSDRRTYNVAYSYPIETLDSNLSNSYTTNYLTNGAEIGYRLTEKKYDFNVALEYQNAQLFGVRILPKANDIGRNFNNLLPSARFKYSFSKNSNLRMFYRSYSRNPSVEQLQDVINNTNPLQLSSGNSSLYQSVNHDVRAMYSNTSIKNNSTFFAMMGTSIVDDYIGNSVLIADRLTTIEGLELPRGGQYSRPVNLDGYKSFNGFVSYGKLVSPIKTNVNLNILGGYTSTPSLINGQRNMAQSAVIGGGIVLASNISENIDYTLSTTSNYNQVQNTLNESGNNNFYNQISRFNINYIVGNGFVFASEINHSYFRGATAAFNQSFLLWNASIGKKLFNSQGEIKIQAYDILGQNRAIENISQQGIYTQSTVSNVLQRYFLATFTWNLRYFKGGASEKDMDNKDDLRPMSPGQGRPMHAPMMMPPGHP